MTSALLVVTHTPDEVAPHDHGLYQAVDWVEDGVDTARWLPSGVVIRPTNYRLSTNFGVWGEDWCVDPDAIVDEKTGQRPDIDTLQGFVAKTVYGWDQNVCGDMHTEARDEARSRAELALRLLEPGYVESILAPRMLTDAGAPAAAADLILAIGVLEEALADTATKGVIHAAVKWAAVACHNQVVTISDGKFYSPLGHQVIFGAGYKTALGNKLVATSPLSGWRTSAVVRDTIKHEWNRYVALAERSVLVGYEQAVKAVTIS